MTVEQIDKQIARENKAREIYTNSKLEKISDNDILLTDIIRGRISDEEKKTLTARNISSQHKKLSQR